MGTLTSRLQELQSKFVPVLLNPASNLKLALVLYTIIVVFLLLLLVIVVMFVIGSDDEDEAASAAPAATKPTKPRVEKPRRSRWWLLGVIVAVLAGVWLLAGYTTSESAVCKSCHWPAAKHAQAATAKNPHADQDCVACHEPGGAVGRYTTDVPVRALHLASAAMTARTDDGYGRVTVSACRRCHRNSIRGTLVTPAGVSRCHTPSRSGRGPLARTATNWWAESSASIPRAWGPVCGVTTASRSRLSVTSATTRTPRLRLALGPPTSAGEQVREVKCDGCHAAAKDCDPCHGVRMPHTTEFMAGAHARAGAVDFWFNQGKTCSRCHTATRRPCTQCHTSLWAKRTVRSMIKHTRATPSGCDTCHGQFATIATRDFCKDVCHSKAAMSASPR